MKITASFTKKIQTTAHRYHLWDKGHRIVIGVSGGPDSMALLYFFLHLRGKYDLTLFVAHVNYRLRGTESNADQNLVQFFCEKNNIPYFNYKPRNFEINEDSLRKKRFLFFKKIKRLTKSHVVALAHHKNDQAETVFFRLLRGSGRKGLSGMSIKTKTIIRPFLFTSKEDIISYTKENDIPYRTDKTNLESNFTRNRIRNILFPLLKEQLHPNIITVLAQTGHILSDEDIYLNSLLQENFHPLIEKKNLSISFSLTEWRDLPIPLRRRALIFCIDTIPKHSSTLTNIHFSLIEELKNMLEKSKSKHQEKRFLGLLLEKKGDRVTLFYTKNPLSDNSNT